MKIERKKAEGSLNRKAVEERRKTELKGLKVHSHRGSSRFAIETRNSTPSRGLIRRRLLPNSLITPLTTMESVSGSRSDSSTCAENGSRRKMVQ